MQNPSRYGTRSYLGTTNTISRIIGSPPQARKTTLMKPSEEVPSAHIRANQNLPTRTIQYQRSPPRTNNQRSLESGTQICPLHWAFLGGHRYRKWKSMIYTLKENIACGRTWSPDFLDVFASIFYDTNVSAWKRRLASVLTLFRRIVCVRNVSSAFSLGK